MLGSELKKIDWKLEAELIAQTKAASKSASRSPKTNKRKAAQAGAPCAVPVFERRLVVRRRCLRFDGKSATSRVKRIWYELERDVCDFLIKDLSGFTMRGWEERGAQNLALMMAVNRWIRKRRNRKQGWRFKCTIADGEKMMSDRIPGLADTFVVYVLIQRVSNADVATGSVGAMCWLKKWSLLWIRQLRRCQEW